MFICISRARYVFFCSHVTMRGREPVGSSILASNANVFTLARKKATMKKEQ